MTTTTTTGKQQQLLLLLLLSSLVRYVSGNGLCLMMYQMADNNLEYFLREDNYELLQSDSIKSSNQNTWIYFDGRNYGNGNQDITEAMQGVYDSSGTSLLTDLGQKYTGSRYLHWENGKMVAETTLSGEQNSDNRAVMTSFLVHAIEDCVSWNAQEYFLVFSSHGGGFAGFGGDDNSRRRLLRGRNLLASNQNIVLAIKDALNQVTGAPSKMDVIGFDACLMQAFGVMDDYRDVTNYLLASQAVEPGHGWAYDTLTSVSGSALDLAKDIVEQFVEQLQGRANHQTPKILSVVSSAGYDDFLTKFESVMAEMESLINANNDPTFYSNIGRARSEAISFEGIVDDRDTKTPSALDIGSFLESFQTLCNPGGTLENLLQESITSYNAMFEISLYGPGTVAATGMHITWPYKSDYLEYTSLWNTVLFNVPQYRTEIAPNFRSFLKTFLQGSGPPTNTDTSSSICGQGSGGSSTTTTDTTTDTTPATTPTTGILRNPTATVTDSMVRFGTNISLGCDSINIEYGVDLTTPLGPFLTNLGLESSPDDYLYLYGGDVLGTFADDDSYDDYTAVWDREFYFLTIGSDSFEAMYVFDHKNGYKSSPVLYIPEGNQDKLATVQLLDFLFWSLDDWKSEVGARYGFLTFSRNPTSGVIDQNLVLYANNKNGDAFYEVPQNFGGYILPIVYVNAVISTYDLGFLPGGFNQTILPWSETTNYQIISRTDQRVLEVTGADAVIADITAVDNDWHFAPNGTDYISFDIVGTSARGGGGRGNSDGLDLGGDVGTTTADDNNTPPSSGWKTMGTTTTAAAAATILLFWS